MLVNKKIITAFLEEGGRKLGLSQKIIKACLEKLPEEAPFTYVVLASGLLYIYSALYAERRTEREIANAMNVSEVSIRKAYKWLRGDTEDKKKGKWEKIDNYILKILDKPMYLSEISKKLKRKYPKETNARRVSTRLEHLLTKKKIAQSGEHTFKYIRKISD
jgi:hypothetical protein